MNKIFIFLLLVMACTRGYCQHSNASVASSKNMDATFIQEYQQPYPNGTGITDNDIRSIAVDPLSSVFIATPSGIFKRKENETGWEPVPFAEKDKGPAYKVFIDNEGSCWIGSWNAVFRMHNNSPQELSGTTGPITNICMAGKLLYAMGPEGVWLFEGGVFKKLNYPVSRAIRGVVADKKGALWIATDVGLYHAGKSGTEHYYKTNLLTSAGLKGLEYDKTGRLWAVGLGGIAILNGNMLVKKIGISEGCPSIITNCVRRSPDGSMWVGTKTGIVRFAADGSHTLLFSRRWLLDDAVTDIAFDGKGNAWVATEKGVSAIMRTAMNLAAKQDYFYDVLMHRHIRAPWIAGQCHLPVAGDTSRWEPEDDDNDGEYTGNYLAMESFRFAVTQNPDAREKAQKAFQFLKTLKEVTNGDGYFARTIVPIEWGNKVHDGNRSYKATELAEEKVKEPRFKPLEMRWHPSADGKWLWKGDASSDEWCGHMMGYFFYYELAATADEKKQISMHVASLVDHLIAHDFSMMDTDGTHTRWSVWSPSLLNKDPEWSPDRCQNSMELLTFLKLAYYLTKDEKYQEHYLRLINKEHYLQNMAGIMEQNPAWFIYFDVTLQAYLYPILLHCEKDPGLLAFYRQHMDKWMTHRINDRNPLINFLYCYARNKKIELNTSLEFLRNTPLDLVDWPIDHSKREDIQLVHKPVLDEWQVNELPPAAIRGTIRWDKNPWTVSSGAPNTEREPVFWLYPYWMGRYLKMIK
jgi:hypothetical protein